MLYCRECYNVFCFSTFGAYAKVLSLLDEFPLWLLIEHQGGFDE
jgi:hypothetical protein